MSGDTFTVRFRPFGGMRSDDSYSSPELKGYGEIEFCVGEIHVRARLNEYFGLAVNVAVFVGTLLAGAGIVLPDPDVLSRLGSDYGPLTVGSGQFRE